MKSKIYITKSAGQTRKIGEKLGKKIVSPTTALNAGEWWGSGEKGAIVLAMEGDLGGGKTTFIQGFVKGLGIKENITSPTFVILKKFEIALQQCHSEGASRRPKNLPAGIARAKQRDSSLRPVGLAQNDRGENGSYKTFYHIDAYRLEGPEDLIELGIEKILSDKNNIIAIEWSEKIQKILPENAIKIKFEFVNDTTRKIRITPALSF